jgi:hypothetical protein
MARMIMASTPNTNISLVIADLKYIEHFKEGPEGISNSNFMGCVPPITGGVIISGVTVLSGSFISVYKYKLLRYINVYL